MIKLRAFFRTDRGILWGTNAFFLALAIFFVGYAWWVAVHLKQSIQADFHSRAEVAAVRTADAVAVNINARFDDLAFLRNVFSAQGTDRLLPSAKALSAFVAFQHTHQAITAINILDPSGNRIVWSSVKQPARPITSGKDFSPLPGDPDRLVGRASYGHRAHAWVLSMRKRIRDNEGHVMGFIGSPFVLSNLSVIHTPVDLQSIVLMRPHGQVISVWKDGHWAPPDTPLPRFSGQVVVPVPGYPWDLQVQWTAAALDQAFWQKERPNLLALLIALFMLGGMAVLTQQLLRRMLRLGQYQAAAVLAQQDLLRLADPEVMYQRLVKVVVEQTEAIGAYVAVPDTGSEWLRVVAASADTPDLQQAMEYLTPSRDATRFPDGNMVPSLAFREKTPQGPVSPHQSPAMTAVQRQQAPLSRIRSVMAYPVFMCEEVEPFAVLVIESDAPRHFTPSLQRLLSQLAATLGLALTQWRHHRELLEKETEIQQIAAIASRRNEQLDALIEAIPDAVFLKDGMGRWLVINEAAKRLFQLRDIPWKGKTDLELADLHPAFRAIHEACLADDEKAWRAGQMVVVEENMVREDGQLATFETRKVPIFGKDGQREGLVIIGRDVTERKATEARIQRMAFYDALTHLPNRRALETEMDRALARAQRNKKLLAVCMLDLDDFKPVNDRYGHESGDEVLITLGKRLPTVLRRTDFVARLGGDEFVLLIEDLDDLDALEPVLNKVEQAITTPIPLGNGKTVRVGMSMGVVLYPLGDWETADRLLREADRALYESKSHKAERERSWVLLGESPKLVRNPVQQLLDNGALEVWYQPILDNRARKVVGVEALARLRDGDGKIWTPAEFLPQLQEKDLFELSRQVFQQTLIDLSVLDALGLSLWVSVNIDPHSVSDACVACLREMIAHGAVDPSRITLEILEGSDFLEQQAALEHLLALKAEGIRLALDDVGSAYASLLRMKDPPIDEIKLDQGFVRTLEERPQDLHFVDSIKDLAAGMGVDLVVEGVETDDILDAVMVLGVKFIQGYGIARPMPLAQLQEFLAHQSSLHRQHPTSLLGLYAAQLANHSTLKKAIRQNPRLVDYMTLVDATICPIHDDLRRLGLDDGGPLDRLHQEYHRAIAVMDAMLISSPTDDDWSAVDQAGKTLERAILEEFRKAKESRDL
jgi:diguanylate cyclase (GGDEF)-like protein/PAS domain S-box-containing protein